MHHRPENAIGARRWGARSLVVAGVCAATLAVQFGLRSDAVVRAPLERRMHEVARDLNGRITIESITPAGLWGVRASGVAFRPHMVSISHGDRPLLLVENVTVEARPLPLLLGRVEVVRVTVDRPRVVAIVDSTGGNHADWFRWLASELQQPRGTAARTEGRAVERERRADAPPLELLIRAGELSLDDPSGRYASLGARVDDVRVNIADGDVALEGRALLEGLGWSEVGGHFTDAGQEIAFRFSGEGEPLPTIPFGLLDARDARLTISALEVGWPPRLVLSDVAITGLDLGVPGIVDARALNTVRIEELIVAADSVGVSVSANGNALEFSGDGLPYLPISRVEGTRIWGSTAAVATADFEDAGGDTATAHVVADLASGLFETTVEARNFDVRPIADLLPWQDRARLLDGEMSGRASLRWDAAAGELVVGARGDIIDLGLRAPLVSGAAIHGAAASFDIELKAAPDAGTLDLDRAWLRVAALGLEVHARGSSSPARRALDVFARLPSRPAQGILDALPSGAVPTLEGFELDGEFGFSARVAFDTADPDATVFKFDFDLDSLTVATFGPLAPLDQLASDSFAWTQLTYEGGRRELGPSAESWLPLTDTPGIAWRAVVAAEDDAFWRHDGFDARGIREALLANIEAGRLSRGGSTISQQVVKNLFLNHDRSLSRKVQEIFLTWQLEQHVSKQRILELYLNLAHWAPGVYGLHDAALAYFNHPPSQLTLRESAFLAAILPNPNLYGRQYTEGVIAPSRRIKMQNILANLHRAGFLSEPSLRYHVELAEQGLVSNTPAPRVLGRHDGHTAASTTGAVGALLFAR